MESGKQKVYRGKVRELRPKCKKLLLKEKISVIELIEKGESRLNVAIKFGITKRAVGYILQKKEKYKQIMLGRAKSMKERTRIDEGENALLEKILLQWINQKRSLGIAITGPMVKEKALTFYEELMKKTQEREDNEKEEEINSQQKNSEFKMLNTFKASEGWLHRFKLRYGISFKEEQLSVDYDGANQFLDLFKQVIEEERYNLDNVYNGDQTGLYFKSLPKKTLALVEEKEALGFKESKQRVTLMNCANATGSHKVPLLLIGKLKNPRCFKGLTHLPVIYMSQENAWMSGDIFIKWFRNVFIPSVETRKPRDDEKFLLLLVDNASCHPSAEMLNSINSKFKIMFLPPNVTSLIQPMDQGIIESLKQHYKQIFLRKLLLADLANPSRIPDFIKQWNLFDTIFALANAWSSVTLTTLSKAWKNLLGEIVLPDTTDDVSNNIVSTLNRIHDSEIFSLAEVDEWIHEDTEISSLYELSDQQLIETLLQKENAESMTQQDKDSGSSTEDEHIQENIPSSSDEIQKAYYYFQKFRKWFDKRTESTINEITCVFLIQDLLDNDLYNVKFKCQKS